MSAPGRVIIAEYDPGWPGEFRAERDRLVAAAGSVLAAVEHVGSTAVPGLAAKPIIDVMGGVREVGEVDGLVGPFVLAGYEYVPEYEDKLPDRRYFRKPPKGGSEPVRFHLHVVEIGSDFWVRQLLFGDFLRNHPDVADEYAALKRRLAEIHVGELRAGYSEAKTEFVQSVLARAAHSRPAI